MITTHKIIFGNSNKIPGITSNSVDLVVTSPPYPMIEMWDDIFSKMNLDLKKAIENENGPLAFQLMHKELDKVWDEVDRVLKPGSIVCINIGDATRKIGKDFCLYSNHSRIISYFLNLKYMSLPHIIWRKQTNAPNKFMGSGMLPPGAYVTLEHEYILILRKGSKREFKIQEEKEDRQKSAFFWEERNVWFSDIWDFKGVNQQLNKKTLRERSAAYPFELVYRLINMFSVKGDTILDPFLGTGTTTIAAMASERKSVGVEIEKNFRETIFERINKAKEYSNEYINERISNHIKFVKERQKSHGALKYINKNYEFLVMTSQEINLQIKKIKKITKVGENVFETKYFEKSQDFYKNLDKPGLEQFFDK